MDVEVMLKQVPLVEDFLKRMANKNRLMILCSLLEGEMSVRELNDCVPLSQSALSQHLAVLRETGLVATRRDGQTIYYTLGSPDVELMLNTLHHMFCTS
ncbi:MAG: metalloregulator ArsR/SmtB family transcription factor [Pseudomonadales bacterium]